MPSVLRMKRINDRVKQILSIALVSRTEDPRLRGVTITDVKIDRELDFANIYVSALDGQARSHEVIAALNHARGFLKHEISEDIDLRVMPKLRFFWDPTPEKADRIDTLLAQIQNESSSGSSEEEGVSDEDDTEKGVGDD